MRSGIVRRTGACFLVVALLPLAATAILSLDVQSAICCSSRAVSASRSRPRMTTPRRCTIVCSRSMVRLDELARRADLAVSLAQERSHDRLKVEFKALGIVDDAGRVTRDLRRD